MMLNIFLICVLNMEKLAAAFFETGSEMKYENEISVSRCYRGGQNSEGTSFVGTWWDLNL